MIKQRRFLITGKKISTILVFLSLFILSGCGSSGGSTNTADDTTEQIDDNTDTTTDDENTSTTLTIGAWEEIETINSPGVIKNHTMVEIDGTLYLYGGDDDGVSRAVQVRGNSLNNLWGYVRGNNTWSEKKPSNPPAARKYHKAVVKNGKMYIFGGVDNNYVPLDDAWVYDPVTNSWKRLYDAGSSEYTYRNYQDVIADKDGNIYMSGGMAPGSNGSAYSDVVKYDTDTNTFTQVASCGNDYARFGHTSFVYDGKFYMGFGKSGETLKNDMVEVDLNTGTCKTVTPIGPVPKPTKSASSILIDDTLLYFGGWSKDENNNYVDNKELWTYEIPNESWFKGEENIPLANQGAAAFIYFPVADNYDYDNDNHAAVVCQGGDDDSKTWFLNVEVK